MEKMKNPVFTKLKDIYSLIGHNLDFIKNMADSNYYYKIDCPYNYDFVNRKILNPVIADYFSFSLYEYDYNNKIIKRHDLIFNDDCICKNIVTLIY